MQLMYLRISKIYKYILREQVINFPDDIVSLWTLIHMVANTVSKFLMLNDTHNLRRIIAVEFFADSSVIK